MKQLIGKPVIVRANVAGVHVGTVVFIDLKSSSVLLKNAVRLWRFQTRDKTGSISDVAANGPDPSKEHQLGAMLDRVLIVNPSGLEAVKMTKAAAKTVLKT